MDKPRIQWTGPQIVSKQAAKYAKRVIEKEGCTVHSDHGRTLDLVLDYLEFNQIPYELTRVPGLGTIVRIRRDLLHSDLNILFNKENE